MPTDRYTKVTLTLILGCLLWLCVANLFVQPRVTARAAGPQEVVVVGLKAPNEGNYWGTWSPVFVRIVQEQGGQNKPK